MPTQLASVTLGNATAVDLDSSSRRLRRHDPRSAALSCRHQGKISQNLLGSSLPYRSHHAILRSELGVCHLGVRLSDATARCGSRACLVGSSSSSLFPLANP